MTVPVQLRRQTCPSHNLTIDFFLSGRLTFGYLKHNVEVLSVNNPQNNTPIYL